jgi:outer membrane receptor protein involved in Fe transport
VTNNTGYFAQLQLGFHDALFATAGLRAEQNSDFGESLTTPLSPRAGLSYVPRLGGATLKLRASYGRAIRAPSPGQKFAFVGATSVVLENPVLGPERQHGWDAGVDLAVGSRGTLGATYYNQTADDLIQQVQLASTSIPTFQFQNVGRVRNTGIELEGALSVGPLKLRAQYGYVRARIEELAPNYTGDLRVGDQALATPKQSAGASLSFTPFAGMTAAAGLTYVGSWNYYDMVAQFSCFGQTGPCRPANRDYIVEYPGFVKLNASVSQQFTKLVSAFVSIDNLANNEAFEFTNSTPVMGRITTVGLRFRY